MANMITASSSWQGVNTGSPGGNPGTYGSYIEVFTNVPFRVRWISIHPGGGSGGGSYNLATDPLGSPVIHLQDILLLGVGQGQSPAPDSFAVDIPAGSDIGWQVEGPIAFTRVDMCITISDTPLGLDVTQQQSSGLVTVTIPGTDDVESSPPDELIASLNFNATWMVLSFEVTDAFANHNQFAEMDLMVGGVGVEVPVIRDLGAKFFKSGNFRNLSHYLCEPVSLDAGQRISIRASMTDSVGAHTSPLQVGVTFFG